MKIEKEIMQGTVSRFKLHKETCFKNTERLLYSYKALKDHVEDEGEYLGMICKGKSGSIITFGAKGTSENYEEEVIKHRMGSLERTKSDVARIERALERTKDKKGFRAIELRYLERKEGSEVYTFEEIAEIMEIDERTVRRYRQQLISEIAIYLFGTDAIG